MNQTPTPADLAAAHAAAEAARKRRETGQFGDTHMTTTDTFSSFSVNAADLLRLRAALYGTADAQALMLRCFKRSSADKINETTVFNCWEQHDDALNAALGYDAPAERKAARDAALAARQ